MLLRRRSMPSWTSSFSLVDPLLLIDGTYTWKTRLIILAYLLISRMLSLRATLHGTPDLIARNVHFIILRQENNL